MTQANEPKQLTLAFWEDYIDELYTLTPEQKYFLLSMIYLDIEKFTSWEEIAEYARIIYRVKFKFKSFVKDILRPLANAGLIETEIIINKRGAKPKTVRLTVKSIDEFVSRLLQSIAAQTQITEAELNRSFEDVIQDLDHSDKHVKGKALELLAIWMIRLTSLRFTKWRKRDYETGDGEVDILASIGEGFFTYRWHIKCKNAQQVDLDVLAKEIGMTFITRTKSVMIVTTGEFTRSAFEYAYHLTKEYYYSIILLPKKDLELIEQDKISTILRILKKESVIEFYQKEIGFTDEQEKTLELE